MDQIKFHEKQDASRPMSNKTRIVFSGMQGFLMAMSLFRNKQAFKYIALQAKITSIVLQIQALKKIAHEKEMKKVQQEVVDAKKHAEAHMKRADVQLKRADKLGRFFTQTSEMLEIEKNGAYHTIIHELQLKPTFNNNKPANEDAKRAYRIISRLRGRGLIRKSTGFLSRWVFVSIGAMQRSLKLLRALK